MTLITLLAIPFLGGLLCWLARGLGRSSVRWIAVGTMVCVIGVTAYLWSVSDYSLTLLPAATAKPGAWVQSFSTMWIARLGIEFSLGLDGLSLLLIALTGLLGLLAVGCSWREIEDNPGFFYLNLLWTIGGVIGVFLATDLFLFFLFWEIMLVPMFFLIAIWGHDIPGGRPRLYAAIKFFVYTQAAGLAMLAAILALVLAHYRSSGELTFSYAHLLATPLSSIAGLLIMLGFFVGFAVKLPVVPLHSWLPDAHSQAPTAGSVILAGVLLKTAAYGLLRFLLPLFPAATRDFAPVAMWLGVLGILYGALCALGQNDNKRLVAYTSISHMGFVLIGIFAGSEEALQGVMVQLLAHGLSAAGLFILCGGLYERLHTRDLRQMGGLWSRFYNLPQFGLFFVLASLGLPGLGNFLGEFLILLGTFKTHPDVAVVASSGLVLSAVYSLILMQRMFYGKPSATEKLADLDRREIALLGTLALALVWLGLYPRPVLKKSEAAVQALEVRSRLSAITPGERPEVRGAL